MSLQATRHYPDTLLVGSRITDVEQDRFKMEYQVVSKKQGKVTTTGTATIVMFDFTTNRKAPISEKLMSAIEQANRD